MAPFTSYTLHLSPIHKPPLEQHTTEGFRNIEGIQLVADFLDRGQGHGDFPYILNQKDLKWLPVEFEDRSISWV